MRLFDGELGLRRFIAGETFSIADITTKVAVDSGVRFNEVIIPDDVPNLRRLARRDGSAPELQGLDFRWCDERERDPSARGGVKIQTVIPPRGRSSHELSNSFASRHAQGS